MTTLHDFEGILGSHNFLVTGSWLVCEVALMQACSLEPALHFELVLKSSSGFMTLKGASMHPMWNAYDELAIILDNLSLAISIFAHESCSLEEC